MFRGLASRCLEPVKSRGRSPSGLRVWRETGGPRRSFYERRRRSGDGRKRDAFEERSAASQEEYFRKETARQLKELRERQLKRKAEREQDCSEPGNQRERKTMKMNDDQDPDISDAPESAGK